MKNNRTVRLVVLLLFVAIVTAVIISGTFAKYTTQVNSQTAATANVAKWSFAADGFGVSRTDTIAASQIIQGKVAPGTSGVLGARIDVYGCEVAVDYTVTISGMTNKPANMVLSATSGSGTLNQTAADTWVLTGSLSTADIEALTTTSEEVGGQTVYHKYKDLGILFDWPYETAVTAGLTPTFEDDEDTTDGVNANQMSFNVTVVGTQQLPVNVTPTAGV